MTRRILVATVVAAAAVAVWVALLAGPVWWQLSGTTPEPCPSLTTAAAYEYGYEPC